ncbi:MAG: mechanosensitive ion channel [Proteobacteria bacterium]|nr:mechanosensitive ion channel [Pseudomonadota bacterium]NIS70562.1 mechanosensitive ion channel [Pseudomonadota bacterium]
MAFSFSFLTQRSLANLAVGVLILMLHRFKVSDYIDVADVTGGEEGGHGKAKLWQKEEITRE